MSWLLISAALYVTLGMAFAWVVRGEEAICTLTQGGDE